MLSKILERNRSSLQRMTSEYRESLKGTTVVPVGGKSFQFTSNGGFNGAGPVAGPIIRYEIRIAPDEAQNGSDDNGNGLIDEGSLIRVDTSTAEELILTNTLSTAGSSFTANTGGLDIRLTTSGYTLGATVATEAERFITVYPRN